MSNPELHERVIFMPTGQVPAMTAHIDNDPSREMVSLHEPPRRGSIVPARQPEAGQCGQ